MFSFHLFLFFFQPITTYYLKYFKTTHLWLAMGIKPTRTCENIWIFHVIILNILHVSFALCGHKNNRNMWDVYNYYNVKKCIYFHKHSLAFPHNNNKLVSLTFEAPLIYAVYYLHNCTNISRRIAYSVSFWCNKLLWWLKHPCLMWICIRCWFIVFVTYTGLRPVLKFRFIF